LVLGVYVIWIGPCLVLIVLVIGSRNHSTLADLLELEEAGFCR
jgi:hypothetical protein